MDAVSESYGQNAQSIDHILNNKWDVFHERFKQWGVRNGDWDKADKSFRAGWWSDIIDRYVDNILSNRVVNTQDATQQYRLWDIQERVQQRTAANINSSSEYDEAA